MDKRELVRDMKTYTGSSFITKEQLRKYIGVSNNRYIDKYLKDVERLSGKYYFIPEVAGRLKEYCL